ncbi:hypothetical protein [Paenibacillus cymbidii]|uniref:hypothetical protein n=1 Tax=Paenibacillus cymbidii TaxID=1639034 RepID=UPI00108212BD|nr:hypothetical protein [Paenibacillus cymbidii]
MSDLDRFGWRNADEWQPRPWPKQQAEDELTYHKNRAVERKFENVGWTNLYDQFVKSVSQTLSSIPPAYRAELYIVYMQYILEFIPEPDKLRYIRVLHRLYEESEVRGCKA